MPSNKDHVLCIQGFSAALEYEEAKELLKEFGSIETFQFFRSGSDTGTVICKYAERTATQRAFN